MLLLIHIAGSIVVATVFAIVAINIAKVMSSQSGVLTELNQPTGLKYAAVLYPVGPVVLLFAPWVLGFLPAAVIAAACYIPGLIQAHRLSKGLDRAGTDRVKLAQRAASEGMFAGCSGLIYTSLYVFSSFSQTFLGSIVGA
jgi:hypothetical protein